MCFLVDVESIRRDGNAAVLASRHIPIPFPTIVGWIEEFFAL
jgi:hypothetical protein